jgi:ATP-binding cassette, subfamily B, bacterial
MKQKTSRSIWKENIPLSTSPLRFFLFVSRPHIRVAVCATLAVVFAAILSTSVPYVFKLIADAAVDVTVVGTGPLIFAALLYIVVDTCKELMWRTSGYFGSYWATGVRATAREALTSYITKHSRSYFADNFAGSLSNKISNATNGVRGLVENFLWQFLGFFIGLVGAFVLMATVSPVIALFFFGWVFVSFAFNMYRARTRIPYSMAAQHAETKISGATVDLLSNITAMQEYARRSYEIDRIRDATLERRRLGLRNWHFGEVTLTTNGLIQAVFSALMIIVLVSLVEGGGISAGDIILVITLIYRLDEQFLFLGSHINELSEKWGEITESLELIVVPHQIVDRSQAPALSAVNGAIEFKDVRFTYTGADDAVIENFSLSIKAGERIGVVGRSGAGKSTIVKILLRHDEISHGSIAIDGTDISQVTQESLRKNVALVPQEPHLFHRSIRENILYGNDRVSDFEMIRIAEKAQAHHFISRLPAGYDSLVGERGIKLSGGERQRIAIARAMIKNAPILVLDEATSALDSESEVEIQKALQSLMEGKTVIAIAHRLSTLRQMDRIIVLERGAIVEEGSHETLVARGGIYAELWNHQAGGFLQDQ